MRLFHFSEERDIAMFDPIDGLVWAIDEEMAVNYLFPRDCPRVSFGTWESTSSADQDWFVSLASGCRRVLVVESGWLDRIRAAQLVRYAFEPGGFELHDRAAGYWTASERQVPIAKDDIPDLETAIACAGGHLVVQPSLWPVVDRVVDSTLRFSIIRQRNALPR